MYYLQTGTVHSQSANWKQLCRIVRDTSDGMLQGGQSHASDLDLPYIQNLLRDLPGEELAPLALYLISYGAIDILRELWAVRGPFQANLKRDPIDNSCTLNGRPFVLLSDAPNLFEGLNKVEDYEKLLRMISEMGFRGLIDKAPGGWSLLAMGNSELVRRNARHRIRYWGDLPKLDAGVITQGELLQALTMGASKPGMAQAYNRLLCWATPEMVKQHPGLLKPFAVKHEFETNGVFYPQKMTISDWSERFAADAQAGRIGALPSRIWLQPECDDEAQIAQMLLRKMGKNEVMYGFDVEPGFVLCHTTLDFLYEFQVDQAMDEDALKMAYAFVDKYLPLDLMYLETIHGSRMNDNDLYQGHTYQQFLWMLGAEPEVVEPTKKILPPDQFLAIARGEKIGGSLVALLNKTFGFDNQGMRMEISLSDIDTLKAANFRFSEDSTLASGLVYPSDFRGISSPVDIAPIRKATDPEPTWPTNQTELVNAYSGLISMGLWPCATLPQPTSVKDALIQCSRKKDFAKKYNEVALSLRGYLINAGAEACAAEAKTPAQWDYLISILGADAMKPYVELMPYNAKGRVFSDELGV